MCVCVCVCARHSDEQFDQVTNRMIRLVMGGFIKLGITYHYGMTMVSRMHKIIGLFSRILSLL